MDNINRINQVKIQTVQFGLQKINQRGQQQKSTKGQDKHKLELQKIYCSENRTNRMAVSSKSIQSLKQPSHRINFRVIACTSSDSNYSAAQLQLQSPQSKGWVSQRFCTYPQIITIQLIDLAIVQKLTFLSHQSKITTKIDIECKQTEAEMWKKLGYTCMQSNMTTNYEARQLRTVKLNKELVKFFRFTLSPNYVNTINVFNQVSLIAISVYGERYHPKPLDDMKERGILPPGAVLDKQTLDKLRQLEYMKRQAIDKNDFEKASQLKQEIDKLKSGVEALAILQQQKKDAIRREDYEQAKKIYEKMKKIRGPIPRVVVSSNDRYDHDNHNRSMVEQERASFTPIVSSIKNIKKKLNQSLVLDEDKPIKGKDSPIIQLKKSTLPQVSKPPKIINFDEIKVGPKSDRNIYEQEAYLYEQGIKYNQSLQKSPQAKAKFNRNRLSLDQKQLYHRKGRPQQQEEEQDNYHSNKIPPQCEQYFPVVQQMIFKNIFSSDKNLRQHALDEVLNLVDKIQQQPLLERLFINAVIFIVKHVIDDKIVSILLKAVDLLGMMFKEYKPKVEEIERENSKNIKHILEKMSQYIGHSNDKLKGEVQDVYIVLPKYSKSTSKQLCIEIITLNEKIDRAPRSIISKLQMLGRLIRKYDQHSIKQNNSSQMNDKKKEKYQDVIQYAKRFLQDRNSEVRSTAMKLLVYLGKVIGVQEVMGQLQDVREVTRKAIEEKMMSKNDGEASSNLGREDQRQIIPKNNDTPKNKAKENSPRLMSPKKPPPIKDTKPIQSPQLPKTKPPSPLKKPQQKQKQLPKQSAKQSSSPPNAINNPQYICQYCQKYDKRLQNQTFRDIHLFKSCPLITICKQCNQCIEVELLNQHMVQECEKKKFWKKCPRCKESVIGKQYNEHVEQKRCIAAKPLNVANRCPHCHEDIEPKKRGWIKHLVDEGCPCQKDRVK